MRQWEINKAGGWDTTETRENVLKDEKRGLEKKRVKERKQEKKDNKKTWSTEEMEWWRRKRQKKDAV